jgi:hypothetical protein
VKGPLPANAVGTYVTAVRVENPFAGTKNYREYVKAAQELREELGDRGMKMDPDAVHHLVLERMAANREKK